MSILTARSAAVLHLAQIDATKCARCHHPLSEHLPRLSGDESCTHWDFADGHKRQKFCKCARFVSPEEVLTL